MSSMVQDLWDRGLTTSFGGMPNFLCDEDEDDRNIDFSFEDENEKDDTNRKYDKEGEEMNREKDKENDSLMCKFFSSYSEAELFCCTIKDGYVIKLKHGYLWKSSQSEDDFDDDVPF